MTQIVTRESLHTLAALAFASILHEDPNDPVEPEYNLDGGAEGQLGHILRSTHDFQPTDEEGPFFEGFTSGMAFGLDIAAAILTNGFDSAAVVRTVKAALVTTLKQRLRQDIDDLRELKQDETLFATIE
jgi:hypothetical protein